MSETEGTEGSEGNTIFWVIGVLFAVSVSYIVWLEYREPHNGDRVQAAHEYVKKNKPNCVVLDITPTPVKQGGGPNVFVQLDCDGDTQRLSLRCSHTFKKGCKDSWRGADWPKEKR